MYEKYGQPLVAPFAGAWIEISNRNEVHQAWFATLPSREHVRKRIVTEKMSKKMGERHMDYFAHIDGKRKQSVLEHSEGVARLAGLFDG